MDKSETVFDGMILFCSVVENHGFSTAARELGHTPSHVSKQIVRLEERLGTRLLNRTTRSVSLTDMGQRYFEQARQIIEDARVAQNQIHDASSRPSGTLKVSVPVSLGLSCLNAWFPKFLNSFPDIHLNIESSDRMVDVVAEGFDVVVRAGYLKDSELIAKRLFTSRLMTVASPAYLRKNGMPEKPQDLDGHALISFSRQKTTNAWSFIDTNGKQITVQITPHVVCNSAETEEALALAHVGITRLPSFACQNAIADKSLIPILEAYEKPPIGIYAVYPSRSNLALKVRLFLDFLTRKFDGAQAW
jgi:DNA-binding transcriptional LysR family regulator